MTDTIAPQTVLARNSSILFNDFDDGIMMMDIDSGNYFDVDEIGAQIWKLLEEPKSLDALCESLVAEYDVDEATCRAQTAEFIGELVAKGLIRPA